MLDHGPPRDTGLADPPRWTELAPVLHRVAFAVTRNHADADDIVQIALMRAVERARCAPHDFNWRAWLITVARNLALDVWRKKARSGAVVRDPLDVPSPELDPDPAWQALGFAHVESALSRCNRIHRDVFVLHHIDGLRYEEIAERLQLPVGTVSTRLHRARKAVRRALEPMLVPPWRSLGGEVAAGRSTRLPPSRASASAELNRRSAPRPARSRPRFVCRC
jgi:RNA polymerase sigma-70 factor (ECF subfamily)